jgi:fibro-slime domain-containing protein
MSNGAKILLRRLFLCVLATTACASPAGHDRGAGTTGGQTGTGSTQGTGNNTGSGGTGTGPIKLPPTMVSASCGNGMVDAAEDCDDGNKNGGDGCSFACRVEADWSCPPTGGPCSRTSMCGDGKLAGTETCDDGNAIPGDGCSADCGTVEPGYQCRVPGKKCVPLCGDMKMTGGENCDDGNQTSGDGCSTTCLTEPGWSCDPTTGGNCTKSDCGNGKKEAGESCDKGADNGLFFGDASGCSKTCTQEPNCRTGGVTAACQTPCGDANIDPGEDCDDGNQVDGDGCSKACKVEGGFTCAAEEHKDTQACSDGGAECLVLPITYRDFDGQNVSGSGHPDFFYLGGGSTCVPNASGNKDPTLVSTNTCWTSDSTDLCQDLVKDTLAADGKPALGTKTACPCRFTDWDDTGIINTSTTLCVSQPDGGNHKRIETSVNVIKSADTFNQWYHDGTGGTNGTKIVDKLELALVGGNQYQFSSSGGRTVYNDIHDIFMGTGVTSLSSGFFPAVLEASNRTKVCNIWPYWKAGATCAAAAGNPVVRQWDPTGSSTPMTAGTGGPVAPVTGMMRNFYFTSEIRYLFRYVGGESLAFYGDDDVWVFVNGHLVLDLGAPHERLQGTVTLNGDTASSTIQTGLGPVTKARAGLGLEAGKTYEIAVFHADRHPRESNYQLTLQGFSTSRSNCEPRCGDGVTTAAEECDDGAMNMNGVYGGCTTECKFGPFCGDKVVDSAVDMATGKPLEECDNGRDNGATYGQDGCTAGCKTPHRCGDGILDGDHDEQCDDGANNGVGDCDLTCKVKVK